MRSDGFQQGYNDFLSCQEYYEKPQSFSHVEWLDYLEGVRAAAKGDD